MSITSLAHVCLRSTDLDKTSHFYCDILGMKKQFNFTKKGKIIGFYMKASENTFVEVFLAENPRQTKTEDTLSHFCLECDSLEPAREALAKAGYEPTPIKLGADESYQFWVTDPNGIRFEFHQYTPQSHQRLGGDVEVNW